MRLVGGFGKHFFGTGGPLSVFALRGKLPTLLRLKLPKLVFKL